MANYTSQRMSDPKWNGPRFSMTVVPMVVFQSNEIQCKYKQCEFPIGSSNAVDQWMPSQWVKCVANEPMLKFETNDEPMAKWSMDIRVGLYTCERIN